jgi:Ca2+-binding EF-hand superfamily protein
MFDKDGSGGITKEEIKMVLSESDKYELPDEILTKIMAKVDANHDGVISADEFKTYMRQATL